MRCPKCGHEFKSPVAVAGGAVAAYLDGADTITG